MYKVGQKLVCINTDWLLTEFAGKPHPVLGEVVTIEGFPTDSKGVFLVGYDWFAHTRRISWLLWHFRPIEYVSAKSELINSFKEVVESPDCPINIPA